MKFDKNKEYYEQLDKRTKEYKQWKEWHSSLSEGLGDTVAKVTKATGVDKVVDKVAKALGMEDCGCDERKKKLNKFVRYSNPECLEEDEFVWLSEFFDASRTRVTPDEQKKLLQIFNKSFHRNMQPTSCGGCLKRVVDDLRNLIKAHR